jgi:hypothetical protein
LIIIPNRHDFGGIIDSVATIEVMGNVSGVEISAVIGHGDRPGIKVLQQPKIGFSGLKGASSHIAYATP